MSPDFPSTPPGPDRHDRADARFQELFEQAPTSIQLIGLDGCTLRVNRAWENLWQIHAGTPLYDLVLGTGYCLLQDPQLIATGVAGYLQRALDGESVDIPAIYYDVGQLGTTGRPRWVTARAHPVKDGAGRTVEVMLDRKSVV